MTEKSPGQQKAPIDWARWVKALASVVGAIAVLVRSLRGD